MQFNIRCYHTNKNFLSLFLSQHDPDIILLNSTCLSPNTRIKHYTYSTYQSPPDPHDGVAILIKSSLRHSLITHPWISPHFLAVKIFTHTDPIIIATTYVRPNTLLPYADLTHLFNHCSPVFILADFNARHPIFDHTTTNTLGTSLANLFQHKRLNFLGPDFPTFISGTGQGRPDLAFSNRLALHLHSFISPGPPLGSDHIPILCTISTNPILIPTTPHKQYTKADWDKYTTLLSTTTYETRYQNKSIRHIETQWQHVISSIKAAAESSIPSTIYTPRFSFHPSARTKRLITCYHNRYQHNIYHRHHRLISPHVFLDINYLRRHIIHSLADDHNRHWQHLISKASQNRRKNPTLFWKDIKKLRGTSTQNCTHLIYNNQHISDPQQIADTFKQVWENVYLPHPPSPHALPHTQHVINTLNSMPAQLYPSQAVDLNTLNPQSTLLSPVTTEEVKVLCKQVKRKAPGNSAIGKELVSHLPAPTIEAITHLYNASLASGYFPIIFKHAIACVLPKPHLPSTNPLNFRLISLLETLGKTFEKIVNSRLLYHFFDHQLLNKKHFGFRPLHSPQDALLLTTSYINNNTHTKYSTVIITKDIKKAFDTVWHEGLKYKICCNFNLPVPTQRLLCNFLDDRTVQIKFKNCYSAPFTLKAGVPQGSVLAPTLYNMYTNDLPDPLYTDSLTLQFADDVTQLIRVHRNRQGRLADKAQTEINRVLCWERDWRLLTHPDKSKITYFKTSRANQLNLNMAPPPSFPPNYVAHSNNNKMLGLTLDPLLRMTTHATRIRGTANSSLSTLHRFRSADTKTKKHLYKALILPILTYSPNSLLLMSNTRMRSLQQIQNKALRIITNTHWTQFIRNETLHNNLNIAPLNHRLKFLGDKHAERFSLHHPNWCEFLQSLPAYNPAFDLINNPNLPFPPELYS